MTFIWELMQKACELELSLQCSMKMLSHLSLEKLGPLELLLQQSGGNVNQSFPHSFSTSFSILFLFWEEERERESIWAKFVSLPSKYEIIYYVISGITMHSVSRLLFWLSDSYWSHSSCNSHSKNEKMVNKPHKFTFFSKAICCFSCYCLPLKQDKPKLYCICAPSTLPWKIFWENSAFNFWSIRPWSVWAVT